MKIKGGRRPGAGRRKGVPNKVTAEARKRALESGASPLDIMLSIMREPEPKQRPKESVVAFVTRWKHWVDQRLDAAKAAAPYVHPRLQAIEETDKDKDLAPLSLEVVFVAPK